MVREFKPVRFFVMMALAATWDQGFENGYTDGFNKTHPRQ
jgi:hypothetical protein